MLRVGVMLDSCKTSAWGAGIFEALRRSDYARIESVVLNTPLTPAKVSLGKRLKSYWKLTAFTARRPGTIAVTAPGKLGTHTYTRTGDFEVIDGNFPVRFPKP